MNSVREISPSDFMPELLGDTLISIRCEDLFARNQWNVLPHELLIIGEIARVSQPKRLFEMGTFDGRTTRHLANKSQELNTEIFTLDLPAEDPKVVDSKAHYELVGREFRNSKVLNTVQLWGDSATFDFTPFHNTIDMFFVDGVHNRAYGTTDTQNALNCVRSGGLLIFHDFSAQWVELMEGVLDVLPSDSLYRFAGTSLAVQKKQ